MMRKLETQTSNTASLKMIQKVLLDFNVMVRMLPREGWKSRVRPFKGDGGNKGKFDYSYECGEAFDLVGRTAGI